MLSRISRKVFQQNAVSVTNSVRSGRATLVSVKEFSIAARMNHDFEIPNKYNFNSTSNSNSENKVLELDVKRYGAKKHIPVTLNSLVAPIPRDSDQAILEKVRLSIASFLHRELPIRLANRIIQLEKVPEFRESENIQRVCSWYKESFAVLRSCEAPVTVEKEEKFSKIMGSLYERHSHTLITMAKGAQEIRSQCDGTIPFIDRKDLQQSLDEFYMSRIGIRMLAEHYLAVRKKPADCDMVGIVCTKTTPYEIAKQAIADASYVCRRTHGDAPKVELIGRPDLSFSYIPSHMSYILLELLKNSMRATVEFHGVDNKMPPIKVIIADSEDNEDVAITVSDEGGGIKRSEIERVWSYLYTTVDNRIIEQMLDDSTLRDFDKSTPLAGLGYGLPIARNYARYFGGDLTLMSMEGYGTDSYIHFPRLGDKSASVI